MLWPTSDERQLGVLAAHRARARASRSSRNSSKRSTWQRGPSRAAVAAVVVGVHGEAARGEPGADVLVAPAVLGVAVDEEQDARAGSGGSQARRKSSGREPRSRHRARCDSTRRIGALRPSATPGRSVRSGYEESRARRRVAAPPHPVQVAVAADLRAPEVGGDAVLLAEAADVVRRGSMQPASMLRLDRREVPGHAHRAGPCTASPASGRARPFGLTRPGPRAALDQRGRRRRARGSRRVLRAVAEHRLADAADARAVERVGFTRSRTPAIAAPGPRPAPQARGARPPPRGRPGRSARRRRALRRQDRGEGDEQPAPPPGKARGRLRAISSELFAHGVGPVPGRGVGAPRGPRGAPAGPRAWLTPSACLCERRRGARFERGAPRRSEPSRPGALAKRRHPRRGVHIRCRARTVGRRTPFKILGTAMLFD